MNQPPFLAGNNLTLRALTIDDAGPEYLAWLNDPEVLRYRGPKARPTTMPQLEAFVAGLADASDLVLAIIEAKSGRHIGNIALNTIVWVHGSAELSIMIGARDVWGRGYGREAIEILTAHGFDSMGLHRLWAESPNPGFNKAVERAGWRREGVKREAFLLDGAYVDFVCWSLLENEYRERGRG